MHHLSDNLVRCLPITSCRSFRIAGAWSLLSCLDNRANYHTAEQRVSLRLVLPNIGVQLDGILPLLFKGFVTAFDGLLIKL